MSTVNMNKSMLGLSCSRSCVYPYELPARHIPDGLMSRDENSVSICGEQCSTYGCYNRNVMLQKRKHSEKRLNAMENMIAFLLMVTSVATGT